MLEHHPDFFTNFVDVGAFMGNIFTINQDLTACDGFKTVDHAQDGTFPRTGCPDHNDHFIVRHIQIDTLDHIIVTVTLVHIFHFNAIIAHAFTFF